MALVLISGCHWSYSTSVFDSIHLRVLPSLKKNVPGQSVNRRRGFQFGGSASVLIVVTAAGPAPIDGPFAELTSNRVLVDVVDRGLNRLLGSKVPIISTPFLPESKAVDSRPFADHKFRQERVAVVFQAFLDSSRKGGLQRLEEQVDPYVVGRRLNENVNVIGHEDIGDQSASLALGGKVKALREESSPIVVRQKRHPTITRECQLVAITGLMEPLDGLPIAVHGQRTYRGGKFEARLLRAFAGALVEYDQWHPELEHCSSTTSGQWHPEMLTSATRPASPKLARSLTGTIPLILQLEDRR